MTSLPNDSQSETIENLEIAHGECLATQPPLELWKAFLSVASHDE